MSGPYDPGTQVTVSAHTAAGFQFDGWTVDGQHRRTSRRTISSPSTPTATSSRGSAGCDRPR
ncbi:hypothetical protein [Streptomyces sp. NPDC005209]|uniref:InlB B-repeat-containing protein n=1 Tax=Streptomyces sp. NPDC005209 TaxID=3156715 RepID=UPI0033BE0EEA